MEKFQQLIITEEGSISTEEKQFLDLHNEVLKSGSKACEYVIQMAKSLKEMRDQKLYEFAGFETFGDYTEKAAGIKERQAYNYIKVYENFDKEFLQSNAKLGITKLSLLSSLPESDRIEIIETVDIDNSSVKELKETIQGLEKQNTELQLELDEKPDTKKLEKEVASNKKKLETALNEQANLQAEIDRLKTLPKEKEIVIDPETAKSLEKVQKDLLSKENEIEILNKKLLIANDLAMTKFKVKFEDLQRLSGEIILLLDELDAEKQSKCKSALKKVVEGWKL
ncbi:MAG: DUF3102 domain-containing protein [Erysipelotrichales bacterium]|nr:DUF3102 domain-containing protein [Erysipelotrichales bacterium]